MLKRRKKERKASSHFRFCKCPGEFIAQEFPELFLGLQKLAKYVVSGGDWPVSSTNYAKYYICISRLFLTLALQKNGRMQYKQKENIKCLPLALSSKRHVIV